MHVMYFWQMFPGMTLTINSKSLKQSQQKQVLVHNYNYNYLTKRLEKKSLTHNYVITKCLLPLQNKTIIIIA